MFINSKNNVSSVTRLVSDNVIPFGLYIPTGNGSVSEVRTFFF